MTEEKKKEKKNGAKTQAKVGEQGQEVAKKEPVDGLARISGKDGKMAGTEGIDMQEDIIMPRVAILQGLSQMVVDGKGKMGDLADSLSKENLGQEIIFIPLFLFKRL